MSSEYITRKLMDQYIAREVIKRERIHNKFVTLRVRHDSLLARVAVLEKILLLDPAEGEDED